MNKTTHPVSVCAVYVQCMCISVLYFSGFSVQIRVAILLCRQSRADYPLLVVDLIPLMDSNNTARKMCKNIRQISPSETSMIHTAKTCKSYRNTMLYLINVTHKSNV